jgi:hypothetical protein
MRIAVTVTPRWLVVALFAWAWFAAPVCPAFAQEPEEPLPSDPPVMVLSAASFERLMAGMDLAFDSAGRPEMSDTVGGMLAKANDLKGFHRDRPVGLMIFLNGLVPDVVGFVPVTQIDDLIKTVELGPVKPVKKSDTRYEITGPRGTLFVELVGNYAFAANNESVLERKFPDPTRLTARQANSYDISFTVNLRGIPKSSRQLFLGVIRSRADADLQRRDNEPEGAYDVRRAAGESNLQFVEELVTQGDELTFGWAVASANRQGVLEIVLQGTPGSELSQSLNELAGKRSHFAGSIANGSPLTFSVSWNLDKSGRKTVVKMLEGMQKQMGLDIAKSQPNIAAATKTPTEDLFRVLTQTATAGHVDGLVQVVGNPNDKFALVGGFKLADAAAFSSAMAQVVTQLKDNPEMAAVQLNSAVHRGVSLHRFEGKTIPDDEVSRYGGRPSFYIGSGEGVLWFSVGADNGLPALKQLMDNTAKPVPTGVTTAPLTFVANFGQLMDFLTANKEGDGGAQFARNTFKEGGDALKVEVRPVENGARLRAEFNEAFLKLAGRGIVDRIEDGERRRKAREERQKAEKSLEEIEKALEK